MTNELTLAEDNDQTRHVPVGPASAQVAPLAFTGVSCECTLM